MAHFKKKSSGTKQEIPTSAMPDIVFILLIFFMVTTVLRTIELKVRINFTQAQNIEKITQKRLISYIYVGPQKIPGAGVGDVAIQIDDAIIEDVSAIQGIMAEKYEDQPKLIVSLRVDEDVDAGIILDVQQELRDAGTLRINYSTQQETEG